MLKHHCHLAPCQNVNSSYGSLDKSSDASKIYAGQLNVKVLHLHEIGLKILLNESIQNAFLKTLILRNI